MPNKKSNDYSNVIAQTDIKVEKGYFYFVKHSPDGYIMICRAERCQSGNRRKLPIEEARRRVSEDEWV